MGENSKIEWTDHTWNPWMGCHKVSQGCKNCYMFREQDHYGRNPNVVVRSKTKFWEPLKWEEPAKVFTCSWSDFFIEEADTFREAAWDLIRMTSHLTYQILTKRPENILTRLPLDWGSGWPNVWLGISAEDQENADKRIPLLFEIPAAVRFISAEPLLGPINMIGYLLAGQHKWSSKLQWIIVGGESGPRYRTMNPEWAQNIRMQCKEAGVAFFMKQLGGWPDKRGAMGQFPEDLRVREFPSGYE